MDKETFSALVKKYLEGNATYEEKQFLESYYEELSSGRTIENILTETEIDELGKVMYGNILSEIHDPKVKRITFYQQYRQYIAIAASVIILISAAMVFFMRPEDKSMITYAKPGNILKFELSDGTVIWLNSKSKLTYPESFKDKKLREVYLEGEAYFEVKKDKAHPFLVHTRNLTTRVLGTKFNIQAYSSTKDIEVTLLEGKVMLTTDAHSVQNTRKKPDTIYLKPNEKAVFESGILKSTGVTDPNLATAKAGDTSPVLKTKTANSVALSKFSVADASTSSSWRTGELVFNNEPLENVLASLNSKFNVVIRSAPALSNYPITAQFNDESIDDILVAITNQIKRKPVKGNSSTQTNAEYKKLGADYYIE
jgi:transmembrane sensor